MTQDMNHTITKVLKAVLVAAMMSLAGGNALAQVKVKGNVYGGGNAADVQTNTVVNISAGSVEGNVYGGGNLGDVGTIDKSDTEKYNYSWTDKDGTNPNASGNNDISSTSNNNTGISSVNISGSTVVIGPTSGTSDDDHGNVFGGGKGLNNTFYCEKGMVYATSVSISAGTVKGDVFGGGEIGRVEDDTKVTIGDGTSEPNITGDVFGAGKGLTTHGYSALVRGNSKVTVQAKATIGMNVYGGGEIASVGKYVVVNGVPTEPDGGGNCTVIIKDDATVNGNVVGAGKGVAPSTYSATGANRSKRMMVYDDTRYTGTSGSGNWAFITDYDNNYSGTKYVWEYFTQDQYFSYLETLALASETEVTIGGTTPSKNAAVIGNIYGGSEVGFLQLHTQVTILDNCEIGTTGSNGNVYAGGRGLDGYDAGGRVSGYTNVAISGGTMHGSVYGGGENGYVKGGVKVNVTGGTVENDVYGGGALADTNTGNGNEYIAIPRITTGASVSGLYEKEYKSASGTAQTGVTYYELTGGKYVVKKVAVGASVANLYVINYKPTSDGTAQANKTYYNNIHTTTVRLTGGVINGDAYGGGLGDANTPAYVWGDVLVDLNGETSYGTGGTIQTTPITGKGCVVGSVFGCNNVNGTPKGEVLVHVHATQKSGGSSVADKTTGTYDVQAVYGGGNQAEYYPVRADDTNATEANHVHTNVIIDGCTQTSIEAVYGGGNAASTPATCVTVNGAYEIGELFGGGNGKSTTTFTNPGANVGFHAYDAESTDYDTPAERLALKYGFGKAQVNVGGGTIHAVFGGSNSKGNVCDVAIAMLDKKDETCEFAVGKAYGGGKAAEMDGRAVLQLGCVPRIDEVYGGAESAAIHNDVELTITNGTYKRIFGGNNKSGSIDGTITINIEETGCTPIVIGQLFAGGNEAAYTTPSGKADPVINVKSFTSIGQIFGGGFGPTAKLTGNPTIYIDEIVGDKASAYTATTFEYDNDTESTSDDYTVAVPAHAVNTIGTIGDVYGGGYGADVDGNVTVNIGTQETITFVGAAPTRTGLTVDNSGNYTVTGVDIARNVYGGGYGAATTVTGNVAVNIGGEKTEGSTTTYIGGNIAIGGSVYGGSALGAVNASTTKNTAGEITAYTPTENATTTVTLKKGTVSTSVFGGGMGNDNTQAKVYGKAIVNFYGEVIAEGLYGGCDANGRMFSDTELNLIGGRIGDAFTAVPEGGIPEIVFGGGLGTYTIVDGIVTVNVGSATGGSTIYSNVYGGSKNGSVAVANVNLLGGTIWGNVFGGGYQTADGKTAATDVNVKLDGTKFVCLYSGTGTDAIPQTGQIFGCNNLQGSPTGHVKVWVKRTVDSAKDGSTAVSARTTYDVAAVYGGGNKANYEPTSTSESTEVLIEGCELTSIDAVYGGGNAAAVPATNVTVNGSYIINRLYGGGNGAGVGNPGADVIGKAITKLNGGYINSVYGGSNTKGDIGGGTDVQTKKQNETAPAGSCPKLIIGNLYGAGSHADVEGDVNIILECMPEDYVAAVYGGAEEATIKGNVKLTVTSGKFGRVFGGNNLGGSINGSITVYVKEEGCKDLEIGELFGAGNQAPYSKYGCYLDNTDKKWKAYSGKSTANNNFEVTFDENEKYPYPVRVFVESCTSIGRIFGGGLGSTAEVTGDTYVNINMMYGSVNGVDKTALGRIGQVFGGGSEAKVKGNTIIDIGTETANSSEDIGAKIIKTIGEIDSDDYNKTKYLDPETNSYIALDGSVYGGGKNAEVDGSTTINIGTAIQNLGTKIDGNVYGGGMEGDVTGNTQVNVCAIKNTDNTYSSATLSAAGVTINGNIYGGGKGEADDFFCAKAMVGTNDAGADAVNYPNYSDGNTTIVIGNGTVNGTVYGGGEIGRVEMNTSVTIGLGDGTETSISAPEIKGSVFGGGKGEEEHGYAALVRGNPTVTIQGKAKIGHSVYGGGEIASVARYNVPRTEDAVQAAIAAGYTDAKLGMPYALKDPNSGTCTVIVRGYAEIGPDGMQMTKEGGPDDTGYVFGAGKGILPGGTYAFTQGTTKRMVLYDAKDHKDADRGTKWQWVDPNHSDTNKNVWEYFADLDEYIRFIQTLALSSRTYVTIDGNALVKGSVYGGSENGIVQFDTDVKIQDGQIGIAASGGNECASWTYAAPYAPYDPYAKYKNPSDNKYYYDTAFTQYAEGGAVVASDGHTYYGNVFGGGSGSIPYFDTTKGQSVYLHSAGQVKGDTHVTISGGHILTNVYGGCEATNVSGTAYVTMTDGTIGVERTDAQIIAHPLTGYLFGGGKGDQRVFFNKDTNVKDAVVKVEGGRIYGSVYGGGEDGHVLRNTEVTIGKASDHSGPTIGTNGTSYYDGHLFGGGRGFGGEALTAGNVGGAVTLTVEGGSILGSVYGGGRMASVGYGLYLTTEEGYGIMRADNKYDGSYTNPSTEEASTFFNKGRGHIIMNISGGTIGNDSEYAYDANNELTHTKGGNVFAGGMGNFYKQDGATYIDALDWWKLGSAKSTKLTISGNAKIKSCVYGGGELGQVVGSHATTNAAGDNINIGTEVIINGGTIGTEIKDGETVKYTFGSVFGGGYGSLVEQVGTSYPKYIAGRVKGGTKVNMTAGTVRASVYGGGEMAAVGESVVLNETLTEGLTGDTHVMISGGTIGKDKVVSGEKTTYFGGAKMGNVYGGGSGHNNTVRSGHVYGNTNVTISGTDTRIYHNVYGGGAYGSVGEFVYSTGTDAQTGTQKVNGISGRHTDRANTGVATVAITGGTIGIDGKENGMVFGSSRGDINKPGERDDHTAWVYDAHVTIGTQGSETGPDIKGSLYGSGENGHTFNDTEVTVHSGTIGVADDPSYPYRGNVYGGGCGTDKYYSNTEGVANPRDGNGDKYNPLAGIVYGNATINIDGGTVVRNVYGAGAMGSVGKSAADGSGKTTINISGGTIGVSGNVEDGNVYGAARGDLSATGDDLAQVQQSEVNIKPNTIEGKPEATVKGSVFGGGQAGIVKGSVKVEMTGGNVSQDVYGGGALANTQTSNWDATKNGGTGDWADAEKRSALHKTLVNLVGGTIGGYAYGGGLGRVASTGVTPIEAYVYGDVTVKLNEDKGAGDKGCIVDKIFGCNNLNGTPKGHVQVYVYATQNKDVTTYSTIGSNKTDALRHTGMEAEGVETTYDLSAVYGGGNLAPYDPVDAYSTDETVKAAAQSEVYIYGCDLTSIKQVYGGGNAAPAPATYVRVDGVYEIEELFGGGNGKDDYVIDGKYYDNPGANVGYKNYTHLDGTGDGSKTNPFNCVDNDNATTKEGRQNAANNYMYGSGVAHVEVFGGKIHASYGGSNEKGNISIKAWSKYEEGGTCDLDVPETYGGGKNSLIDGEIVLDIGCTTYMPVIFGGSKDADVNSDIVLNITNGKYDQVFGGNNHSGNINGSITVNIKENGCVPIEIGELYLGGYLAGYSVYGYKADGTIRTKAEYDALSEAEKEAITVRKFPRINVISATKIGDIYGGGYQATVIGDPHINVNMEQGRVLVSKTLKEGTTDEYIYKDGKNTEYATDVYTIETAGDNHYAILPIGTIGNIYGGGNMADIIGDTYVEIGTGTYHNDNGDIVTITPTRNAAHITGDVFGGGNNADVTGNTHVIICANENTSTGKWQGVAEGSANVTIQGTHPEGGFGRGVFGGGNKGEVKSDSYVYLGGGSVNETIYGGGCEADVKGNTHVTMLGGYVFDGVCGGGLSGSVGTIDTEAADHLIYHTGDAAHVGCIGKPNIYKTGTGKCTVEITGGQVGPVEVATLGMTRTAADGGPVSEGWVWGASRGVVIDPTSDPDSDFKTYVYETDVTIGGTAFILEGVVGGGEFGHVRGNTLVKIQDQCQIGVGAGQTETVDGVLKPKRYSEAQWAAAEAAVRAGDATDIDTYATQMPACSHFPYGKEVGGQTVYDTYDPYADQYNHPYPGGSTDNASDGKTWIGCVFGGGSGFMPYENTGKTGYDWDPVAGLVEGNSEVRISGGHILTSVYGGNEITSVNGTSKVTMTGGTIGVPRKKDDLKSNPMIGNLYGAGKGDPRTEFNGLTNVGSAEVDISGGIIFGSVYGGSEDGHVLGNAKVKIEKNADSNIPIPVIGTWGASYVDGNVYGGGMGTTSNILAGLVKGNTKVDISDGTILHNIYGGGAYGSVGEFDYDTNTGLPTGRKANTTGGTATIEITGGTIGTTGKENGMVFGSSRGDVGAPGEIHDKLAWVYDTHVTIGTSGKGTTLTTPLIKGSVYGSGENGHTYNDALVTVHSGTIGITDTSIDGGAAYLYRGNVYGGGCGTDKYYSDRTKEKNDGNGDKYNPLAGIVYGNTTVNIDGGNVVHNVYGAGAMGSVGNFDKNATTNVITFNSGGTSTIAISGGIIGVDGTAGEGNVFGAARGDKAFIDKDLALVKETDVTISGTTTQIKGNVYGGGEVGNVHTNATVDVQGGAIAKNVYGGGKGVEDLFTCEQAMVGVDGEGACEDPDSNTNKNKGTSVTISNGTVGTLNGGVLVEGTGNVYGGGEIGRVEWNTQVTIGESTPSGTTVAPIIYGSVYGAGKGLETHGYSALVRGNSTVTVQGNAKVEHNVYGGGEKSTVGRYWVKNIPTTLCGTETAPEAPTGLPDGMPYQQRSGGICRVTVQGSAQIGPDAGGSDEAGHVFGAGKGVNPHFVASGEGASQKMTGTNQLVPFTATTEKTAEDLYLEFLQTLALATNTYVTIDGSAKVKGSVMGGSENGFVQHDTHVTIQGSSCEIGTTTYGNVYGGGRGLSTFAEAGKVKGNTTVSIIDGTIKGNVYGGGSLGDVGIIDKTDKKDGQLTYNYKWKKTDGTTANDTEINKKADLNTNTGICKVTISGGTIGIDGTTSSDHGNVFGAGKGLATTWWCEKAMAFATNVTVENTGTVVYGNVYGGGQIGRVEDDAKVTIGTSNGTDEPEIQGSVFGAGAGLSTHGYSALVRGNADVTVQGKAQIGGSVYGGGETASVGKFTVVGGLPKHPDSGGTCTVTVDGQAEITGEVFGACKGVDPATIASADRKSMQLATNKPDDASLWSYYEPDHTFIWRTYKTEADYLAFLETLALTSNTDVTINGSAKVGQSVYGGGQRGITLGSVKVDMLGGTVNKDVYGGGALANTNKGNWDDANGTWADGKTSATYTTTVNLLGGTISGDAYGGGLGRKEYGTKGQAGYVSPVEAMVYGDVLVELNNNNNGGDADGSKPGCAVTRIFGCNNLNGTPKGKVKVHVFATQKKGETMLSTKAAKNTNTYDVQAVYGGGNLAPYIPVDATLDYATNQAKVDAAYAEVIIDGCSLTSIKQVYGGGNAAPVPATYVEINRAYEIDEAFGGGNGYDNYTLKEGDATVWYQNPGANVGYYTYASYPKGAGQGSGTQAEPYIAVETPEFAGGAEHKEARLADNAEAAAIRYGSGVATLVVKGGTIHTSYGGSNSKGNVRAKLASTYTASFDDCPMAVDQTYGGGKNAYSDADADVSADCAKGVIEMFGGSKDADFNGNINMLITNGSSLERVFGGNNTSGAVNGSITVTLKEGGCEPIRIKNLYLGGFLAPYSVYGYAKNADGSYKTELVDYLDDNNVKQQKLQRIPLKKGDAGALATPHQDPRINVISATYIGNIFGGGYQAKLVGNPHINVNMEPGKILKEYVEDTAANPFVGEHKDANNNVIYVGKEIAENGDGILEIGTIGNIYGGGNLADIVGDTYVEIGTGTWVNSWDAEGKAVYTNISPARNAATITGNVFGGGKGMADSFECAKAMIGVDGESEDPNKRDGGTHVTIGNGTVKGNVYGGGEIGRVEKNTMVTIGLGEGVDGGTKTPVIEGNVFGAGSGKKTHGYSALVRGNSTVTVQGNAWVQKSVYGGGEIATVGKYKVDATTGLPTEPDRGGLCTVTVQGYAEIGPDNMQMKKAGGPDDTGYVFGACKGVLPYQGYADSEKPQHMDGKKENGIWTDVPKEYKAFSELSVDEKGVLEEDAAYMTFINTLALASNTEVIIKDHAFVKGAVYGGSENGHVQQNTHVTIDGDCQIGNGDGMNRRYTADEWAYDGSSDAKSLKECASWDYGKKIGTDANGKDVMEYLPYDIYKDSDSDGTPDYASDGHTFYGNVFGGGSGYFPYHRNNATALAALRAKDAGYADGLWHFEAGSVGGNTVVDIKGGHILTSVYGGNECTDVTGTTTVNMSGGTVGVPRTMDQILKHPVTCYVFGAGKGDQRINFNTWTNVEKAIVNITGGRIFGSVFGGGEDGHVLGDVEMTISGNVGSDADAIKGDATKIGTTGTSYVDGNIFGGGRGFSGDAQTAGTVGGNVTLNIEGGTMYGSVYGGGRLASVGTMFTDPENEYYGQFKEDDTNGTYGHVKINISGGTIGNDIETIAVQHTKGGNVFGGSMGRLTLLNDEINPLWPKLAQVKTAEINITGGTIKNNVYGGGEMGTVREDAKVTITDGVVGRDVYGGGYGSDDYKTKTSISVAGYAQTDYTFTPMQWAGCVGGDTYVNISGGQVRKSVYGGGEMASVGIINYTHVVKNEDASNGFVLSWPYKFEYIPYLDGKPVGGATHVNITGGRIGAKTGDPDIQTDNGDVYGAGKGIAGDYNDYVFCANVRSAEVTIDINSDGVTPKNFEAGGNCVAGAVYGGGENGHVMEDAKLTITNGLIGHSVYGGGSGKGTFSRKLLKIGATEGSTNEDDYYTRDIYSITAGKVFGNTEVNMTGGHVVRNVYGGGNMGSVGKGNYAGGADDYSTAGYGEKLSGNLWDGVSDFSKAFLNSGKCTVNIKGGTIGYIDESDPSNTMYPWNSTASLPYGNVFGGCRGESAPNIVESPRYLYSPEFFVGYVNETQVTIEGDTKILGSVYGGGMDGHVRRDASVTIKGGEIGLPFTEDNQTKVKTSDLNNIQWLARGNVYGSGSGIGKYKYDFDYDGKYESTVKYNNGRAIVDTNEEDYSTSAGSVTRFTTVNIEGGTIHRNVYGGGSLSSIGAPKIGQSYNLYCKGDTESDHGQGKQTLNEVNITGGNIGDATSNAAGYGGHVFGGSRGDASLNSATFSTSMFTKVNMAGGKVLGSIFGGGEVGIIKGSVNVDITGGEVVNDVYGGGALANTNTANPEGVTNQYTTTVNLLGGTVNDAFGGGLGQKTDMNGATSDVEAIVYGDVNVNLNGSIVTGNVFGCNNYNGTPLGHAKVHVFKTKAREGQAADDYDVSYVFGGGNNADYVPTDAKQSTEVIIEGCDLTSIYEVYGGGYGAATPGTNVLIKGTKIIDNVFGGGYGAGSYNPGANVGYRTGGTTAYGLGDTNTKTAIVQLMAGHVHNVYGGSNTKGDIRGGASITNLTNSGEPGTCANLDVEKVYGGGKNAEMAGGTEIILGCMPNDWIEEIYAGAENADVGNDVSLTITSGKFGRVFGGNKTSGRLHGSIVVNIEENPECSTPIIIGELYAGGNEAPYSIYGYKKDSNDKWIPREKSDYDAMSASQKDAEGIGSAPHNGPMLNVRAFTSIGNIFGGGYGESAVMVGSPVVNINEVEGGRAYSGETKTLNDGVQVTLQPRAADGKMGVIGTVFGGGNAAKVIGDTHVNIGTTKTETFESIEDDPATTENEKVKTVVGADIRGNVYGGGNNAAVEGKTNVVIGEKKTN